MFPGRPDIARNRARQKVHAPHDLLIRRIYPIVSLISWNLSTIRPIDSHPVISYRGLNVFLNYYSINFFSSKIYIYIYTKLRTDINFINKFFPSIRSAIPRIDRIFEKKGIECYSIFRICYESLFNRSIFGAHIFERLLDHPSPSAISSRWNILKNFLFTSRNLQRVYDTNFLS